MARTPLPSRTTSRRPPRAAKPIAESLESRALLSINGYSGYQYNYNYQSGWVAQEIHDFHKYVGELRLMENRSRATPAEFQALRDDARAIGAAASSFASSSGLSSQELANRAGAITTVLDAAPLDGWLSAKGWETVQTRLDRAVAGLNIPPALVNQTFADIQTVAQSAGVTNAEFHALSNESDHLNIDRYFVGQSHQTRQYSYRYPDIPDPSLYYSQHLRGFSRGGIPLARETQATLTRDVAAIARNAPPSERPVISRDASLLREIDAAVPSANGAAFGAAYEGLFASGTPSPVQLAALQAQAPSLLGSNAAVAHADALINDAPSFFQAVGSSQANVSTIVSDAQAYADAGGGTLLNQFRVNIVG